MARKKVHTQGVSRVSRKSGLSRGRASDNSPKSIHSLMVRYNLDHDPLVTGRRLPRVSSRVRAACAFQPFYQRRQMAGWLALSLVIGVLGAWNLMLLFSG